MFPASRKCRMQAPRPSALVARSVVGGARALIAEETERVLRRELLLGRRPRAAGGRFGGRRVRNTNRRFLPPLYLEPSLSVSNSFSPRFLEATIVPVVEDKTLTHSQTRLVSPLPPTPNQTTALNYLVGRQQNHPQQDLEQVTSPTRPTGPTHHDP